MHLQKYPQSCVVVEKDGRRLLLDYGTVASARVDIGGLGAIDAALFTHRHPDHLDTAAAGELARRGVPLYGNADVVAALDGAAAVLTAGEEAEIAGVGVLPVDIPHMPLVDGSEGPPNTGFVLDGRVLHPGDGITAQGVRVPHLLVPIAGPSASARDAYRFIEAVGARVAVPIHYDVWLEDPELIVHFCDHARVVVLDSGERLEL